MIQLASQTGKGLCLCGWLIVSLAFVSPALATHTMGGDITYECLGGGEYEVNLTFFRDCSGIVPLGTQVLTYSSASCGVNSAITLFNTGNVVDVTPICPTETSMCLGGGTSIFGIEQYTFSGVMNLPSGACTDWVLGWENCCRNNSITTLNNPGNQSTFISARLDNTVTPCNNSPVFNNIPTPIVCIGQPVLYNHGVTDPDGDQLVFSLADCYQSAATPVIYQPPFSNLTPLATTAGINIDPNTGELTFTPNQIQIGVICVLVEEYRGGVKIGETVRDMQFSVINCNNAPPVASGVNGNTNDYDFDMCAGGNFCFDILITDVNLDNIVVSWNNGIPNGTFTVANNGTQNPTATFCWQPTVNDIGTHFFTVTVEDDNCPLTGAATYAFVVNVGSSPNSISTSPDQTICQGDAITLFAFGSGATSYEWSPTTGLSNPNILNPVASPMVTTTYAVTVGFPSGCSVTESVTVTVQENPVVSISPAVATICPGSPLTLTANSPTGVNYSWNPGGATTSSITVTPTVATTYTVQVDDGLCSTSATVDVNINAPGTNQCNVLYASPGASGVGSRSDPADFVTALSLAACNDVTIKLDLGTYNLSNTVTTISDNITIEGGFDASNNWRKTSLPGATVIHRLATNPEGSANQERLVAFAISAASNFRFQDVTVSTADANSPGMSTYGFHLDNCSDYTFSRVQVLPGNAANGADGAAGANGLTGNSGLGGDAGSDWDQDDPGIGGAGGDGAGTSNGVGGQGGPDPGDGAACCSDAGFGTSSCCQVGGSGNGGSNATALRAGGGGGGGGCGGEADNTGGSGGNGGAGGGGGGVQCCGGTGGIGGNPATSEDGDNGIDGADGADGLTGGNGPAGTHTGGYFVPGAAADQGGHGAGGKGGTGGGGGGGEGCGLCDDGAGSGGGGGGGGGEGGEGGYGGFGGGGSFAVYLSNNGTNGEFLDCRLVAGNPGNGGAGGNGGNGGNGGAGGLGDPFTGGGSVGAGGDGGDGGRGGDGGNGGNGQAGIAADLFQGGGAAPVSSITNFNLAGQPVIQCDNVSCTNAQMFFYGLTSGIWDFGAGATPPTQTGLTVDATYVGTGRRDIGFGANTYRGFVNIQVDNAAILPNFSTTAPQIGGVYRICAGTSLDFASLNGGTGYEYHWDMGGGAIPNNYDGTNFETVTNVTFNTPGSYTIQLRYDSDCCGLTTPGQITLIVEESPALVIAGPNFFCEGTGGVSLTASGGDSYQWSPPTGLSTNTGPNVDANPTTSTTYTVTALNASGLCADNQTVTVNVNRVDLTPSSSDAGCTDDGIAAVVASAGTGVYSYQWDGGQTGSSVTGLGSGTYGVVVTDVITGCKDSVQVVVGQVPNTLDSYIAANVSVSCNGASDGAATVSTTGTIVGSLTYAWSPAGGTGATTTPLPAGTYTVDITDTGNGCQTSSTVTIPEPAPISIATLSQTDPDCDTYGAVEVSADGVGGPFSYSWNTIPVQTTPDLTDLEPGTYTVTVTDQNGCTEDLPVTIGGPQSPVVASLVSAADASSCAIADGSITVSGSGSGGSLTYEWQTNPLQYGPNLTNLLPGTYTVYVIGANGCADTLSQTLGPFCPLPVEYLAFEIAGKLDHVLLNWETLAEPYNEGFAVERSVDRMAFEEIAWVQSQSKFGEGQSYLWEDREVEAGTEYFYRLKQIDLEGQIFYSEVKSAILEHLQSAQLLRAYPNPTREHLMLEMYSPEPSQLEFLLFNQLGQQLVKKSFELKGGVTNLSLSSQNWAEGIYLVQLRTAHGYSEEFRITKIR